MSFQDFSASGRNYRGAPAGGAANANANNYRQNIPASPSSGASAGSSNSDKKNILNQISEALLQYQRNVGILEKIVQSLARTAQQQQGMRRNTLTTQDELNLQYQAQVDVIGQLEDKVRRLLLRSQQQQQSTGSAQQSQSQSQSTTTGPVVKLQRDFERVQARAKALQSGVERLQKEQKALRQAQQQHEQHTHSGIAGMAGSGGGAGSGGDHYEQMQLQLQQDRLSEEIMREREEEIRNINRGMHQVNEIYKDLANIVSSQQEQVDQIEGQMEDSRANAESGLEQVTKANEKYGSSNCIIS